MSIRNELTLLASKTGYYVDNKGKVYNKFGNNIKSFKNGRNAVNYLVFSIRDLSKWKYAKKYMFINYKHIKNLEIRFLKMVYI